MAMTTFTCKPAPVARVSRANVACRAQRNMWYPGAAAPAHLDGSLPGDYGFDPLRLGVNPDNLVWYKEAELTNARWAMMAVVGIIFTDSAGLPKFWEAGADSSYALDFQTLAIIEVLLLSIFEYKRYENIKKTGTGGLLGMTPFDPLGMNSPAMQEREIKNGRLAMLAFIGFCSQAAVQGMGPVDCFMAHLADPGKVNIYTSKVGPEVTAAIVAASIIPTVIEAKNSLDDGSEEEFNPFPF